MKIHPNSKSTDGAVLIAAVLSVGVLASIAALTLFTVNAKHRNSYQAAGWRDALIAAESGAQLAMAELRTGLDDPANAWTGWVVVDSAGVPAANQTIDKDGHWAAGYSLRKTSTLPPQTGESNQTQFSVVVDVPASLAPTSRRWNQSYRIRSTGVAPIPEVARGVTDKRDTQLRRLSLAWDRTVGFATSGKALSAPQASRTIEIVAKPDSVYKYSLISEITFKMNKKTYIDGYNSNYPDASTGGKYDPTKRTAKGGTILANRWKKKPKPDQAVEKFDVGKATIYGDLLVKGSMKNVKNTENVQGDKVPNMSVDTPNNLAPVWPSVTANIPKLDGKIPDALKATYKIAEKQAKVGGPVAQFEAKSATAAAELAAKGMELIGGSDPANPTRFLVGTVEINNKTESLVISNPPGVTESWVEIMVTGDFKIEKGGSVFLSNGVHATIYLAGKKAEIKDTKVEGGGFFVESGFAADLQIVGVEKVEDTNKESDDEFSPKKRSGKISITDADFTGVINAPDWDVDFKPKDWDKEDTVFGAQLYGSVVGRKVKIGNGADYHFDEALNEAGSVLTYTIAGWNEIDL